MTAAAACGDDESSIGSTDPDASTNDGSTSSSSGGDTGTPPPVQDSSADTTTSDTGTDASTDAPTDSPADVTVDQDADAAVVSPGLSDVSLPGTGVLVGKTIVVTLVAKDAAGNPVARVGANVVFTTAGGTSVVTIGAVADKGDGTYTATITGVTEGTKLSVSATIDGAPLTTTPASLRVVNAITNGLTASLDAANADGAGNFGGKNCPLNGLTTWKDTTANAFTGTLTSFADVCGGGEGSGWTGTGTPADPHRLAFDGMDDYVPFGAVNSLAKQTVLAWVRKRGAGIQGQTGTGGFGSGANPFVFPIVTKGTAQAESDALDINFHLSIATDNRIGSDYEATGTSANAPFLGATATVDNTWAMIGFTFDVTNATRVIWLNGKDDATVVPVLGPSTGSSSIFAIGGAQTTTNTAVGRFKGDVALVLTYDRALTKAEIEATCHGYSGRFGMKVCAN